jgi:RNA polymerase sigma-70 factor (family 1)
LKIIKRYDTLTDPDLSRLLRDGDEGAFRVLYERYWHRLYRVARHRLGEAGEAEELVQDVFCHLWRRRSSFTLNKSFDHYFSTAIKYEVINRLAKRARVTTYKKELAALSPPIGESLLQQVDYHNLQQQLQVTINALPQKSKLVFQLKHEGGYSLQQISHRLGISVKTVEAHLTKARKTIRVVLGTMLGSMLLLLAAF